MRPSDMNAAWVRLGPEGWLSLRNGWGGRDVGRGLAAARRRAERGGGWRPRGGGLRGAGAGGRAAEGWEG